MKRLPMGGVALAAGVLLLSCSSGGGGRVADGGGSGGKMDDPDDVGPDDDGDASVVVLEQGWDEAQRARMYTLSQGSQLLPYAWFLALRVDDSDTRVASPEHMRSLGFIVDAPSLDNPDGLPVGFARDGDALGLTCTACHTGQITIDGTPVRIDGAGMRANVLEFQTGLLAALVATEADDARFAEFADEVFGVATNGDAVALREELRALIDVMEQRLAGAVGAVEPGPGRLDGVGQATNETLCISADIPENCGTFNAPTNPGFLWGLGELSWVQSNGSVHGALPRNVGEALGVFAPHDLDGGELHTAVPLFDLMELEEGFEMLEAPSWEQPGLSGLLRPLDPATRARGAEIFAATCATCHASRTDGPFTSVNSHGVRFVEVPVTPLAEIGTDPWWVEDLVSELALAPAAYIEKKGDAYVARFGTSDPSVRVPAGALRAMMIGDAIAAFVAKNGIAPGSEQFVRLFSFRDSTLTRPPEETLGYRAQPLEGIAFTGPFLHDGSVRTLAGLLEPAAARETEFWVGGDAFDPDEVGFVTAPSEDNAYLFDTRLPGNGNRGHEGELYGTTLGADDKAALLEYLRGL